MVKAEDSNIEMLRVKQLLTSALGSQQFEHGFVRH